MRVLGIMCLMRDLAERPIEALKIANDPCGKFDIVLMYQEQPPAQIVVNRPIRGCLLFLRDELGPQTVPLGDQFLNRRRTGKRGALDRLIG